MSDYSYQTGNGYTSYSNQDGIASYVSYQNDGEDIKVQRTYVNSNGYSYKSYADLDQVNNTLYQKSYSYDSANLTSDDFRGYAVLGEYGYSSSYSKDHHYGATYATASYIQPGYNGGYTEYRAEQFVDAYGDTYRVSAEFNVDSSGNVTQQYILGTYYAGVDAYYGQAVSYSTGNGANGQYLDYRTA